MMIDEAWWDRIKGDQLYEMETEGWKKTYKDPIELVPWPRFEPLEELPVIEEKDLDTLFEADEREANE